MNGMYWQARRDVLKAVLVGALTLCPLSGDCFASAPSNEVRTELVQFGDLDLSRPAGVQALYRRIQQAARDVCGPEGAAGHLGDSRECRSSAIARAVAEVDAPLLTERHRALTHPANLQEREARLEP